MKKIIIRVNSFVVLFIIFVFLLGATSSVLHTDETVSHELVSGFYCEEENTLDAVFIGPSFVYLSYEPPLAWKHYGITTWSYASSGQPFEAAQYIIEEAKKTQPNALFVIAVNDLLNDDIDEKRIHMLTDFMPYSINKVNLINQLIKSSNNTGIDVQLEYCFPVLRFHSRWTEFKFKDIMFNGCKSGAWNDYQLNTYKDISTEYKEEYDYVPLPNRLNEKLVALLDYCDEKNVNALFLTVPTSSSAKDLDESIKSKQFNMINKIIQERGFPVLNIRERINKIGLDLSTDYYDKTHTNIHGAVKCTSFIANYLVDNYHFRDKRGDAEYKDWDKGYENYKAVISPYTLPFEYEDSSWNKSLDSPDVIESNKESIISWKPIEGADGYGIFVKDTPSSSWKLSKRTSSSDCSIKKTNLSSDNYIIVAYQEINGKEVWGKIDIVKLLDKLE